MKKSIVFLILLFLKIITYKFNDKKNKLGKNVLYVL